MGKIGWKNSMLQRPAETFHPSTPAGNYTSLDHHFLLSCQQIQNSGKAQCFEMTRKSSTLWIKKSLSVWVQNSSASTPSFPSTNINHLLDQLPNSGNFCTFLIILGQTCLRLQGQAGRIVGLGYSSSGYVLGCSQRLTSCLQRSARIGCLMGVPTDPLEEVIIFGVSWSGPNWPYWGSDDFFIAGGTQWIKMGFKGLRRNLLEKCFFVTDRQTDF